MAVERFIELIDGDTIQRRVAELGEEITNDYPSEDVVVVCILKGSLLFMKDLMDHLPLTYTSEFISLTPVSYTHLTLPTICFKCSCGWAPGR